MVRLTAGPVSAKNEMRVSANSLQILVARGIASVFPDWEEIPVFERMTAVLYPWPAQAAGRRGE